MQLKKMFYPHQEVVANTEFDSKGKLDGSSIHVNFEVFGESPDENKVFFAQLSLTVDPETSVNPPYLFRIENFGAFEVLDDELNAEGKIINAVRLVAYQILVGATRERLAELTSRGPWPHFLIAPLPMHYADPNEPGLKIVE